MVWQLLVAVLMSPVLSAIITVYLNRDKDANLLNLHKKVVNVAKGFTEDDEFKYNHEEFGNFAHLVYEILTSKSDNMSANEYIKIQQILLAGFKRLRLSSRHDIADKFILPMLYQMSDVTKKRDYSIAVSAVLSALFAMIGTLDLSVTIDESEEK